MSSQPLNCATAPGQHVACLLEWLRRLKESLSLSASNAGRASTTKFIAACTVTTGENCSH